MRIIAGKAKGTKLYTLDGLETRPTLDRVKESFFNIMQNDIIDSFFLDLFSGSGAIGLEAVSRGAKKAILCEKSHKAVEIINKNIEKTHLEKQILLYEGDFEQCIEKLEKQQLDIIYIDPPYKTDYAIKAIKLLQTKKILKPETIIIVETDREEIINSLENIDKMQIEKIKKYGRANLVFLREIA